MMRLARHTVKAVIAIRVPDPLPPAITRLRPHLEAVLAQSRLETGDDGRAALAWTWALTGTQPSPVTLSLPPGRPPTREEILAEASADPEGSTAPPGAPSDYCDQFGETRRILTWLTGVSDEIPLDDEHRGRFIGARDDYARTDQEIRYVRDNAEHGLALFDLPEPMDSADADSPWRWDSSWMNAAWQRGVRDVLGWVLGERAESPLGSRVVGLPTVVDLSYEEAAATDVIAQGQPGGRTVTSATYPPPQYGEAIQATIDWLRGETTEPPVDQEGHGPYRSQASE